MPVKKLISSERLREIRESESEISSSVSFTLATSTGMAQIKNGSSLWKKIWIKAVSSQLKDLEET